MEEQYNNLDSFDLRYILEDEDEQQEIRFRWEYAHESTTQSDSIFRKILPDT